MNFKVLLSVSIYKIRNGVLCNFYGEKCLLRGIICWKVDKELPLIFQGKLTRILGEWG